VAFAPYHTGAGNLTQVGIRHSDYLHLIDTGLLRQESLNLGGVDVLTTNLQHILVAAQEPKVTVLIYDRHIARVESAVEIHCLCRFLRLAVVALYHVVSPDGELPL